jgi:hypothetical protein
MSTKHVNFNKLQYKKKLIVNNNVLVNLVPRPPLNMRIRKCGKSLQIVWPTNGLKWATPAVYEQFIYTRSLHSQNCITGFKKQSKYKPGQTLRVPGGCGSQISRQSAHIGVKVVNRMHRPPLPHFPRKYSWYSFLIRLQGHNEK